MAREHRKLLKFFTFRKVIIPVIIGLGVASWLLYRGFDRETFIGLKWTYHSTIWLSVAIMLMAIRDIAYMYRLRVLTDKKISWRNCFQVIMLWEFASSVTPTVVGGSAVALFIIKREGLSMGRTTAVVFVTALLDELFYITMVPLMLILVGTSNLLVGEGQVLFFSAKMGTAGVFAIGYLFICTLTAFIVYGIFINPHGFKRLLIRLSFLKIFKRWRKFAAQTGDEIIATSKEMKGKPFMYWFKAFGATLFSWTARFWVVNFLIMAITGNISDNLLIYARQLIMWVILLVSPTPGSSGTAEYFFPIFLGDFTAGISDVVAVAWRLISYYPYLFIGVIVLPNWIRRVYFGRRKSIKFRST